MQEATVPVRPPQARKLKYTKVTTTSRNGVSYTRTRVEPGFTPSLAPRHNPLRDVRRRIEKRTGPLSGKQWRKYRQTLRRAGRWEALLPE